MLNSFIQWNLQSYFTKFSEIKILLREYMPVCMCLQETLIRRRQAFPPSQYDIVTSKVTREDGYERGAAILVNKLIRYELIDLQTQLQATTIKIHTNKSYTVCSLYLPHMEVGYDALASLIDQLQPPFVIMGDMNARSTLWQDTQTNERGRIFERLVLDKDIIIMNNGTPTHYSRATGSKSVIDLTICSSDCCLDFEYSVSDELHGSDHYPIQLGFVQTQMNTNRYQTFNTEKANWEMFNRITAVDSTYDIKDTDEVCDIITATIINAAGKCIPRTSNRMRRPPVPWWNKQCDDAKRERTRAERAMKRRNTPETRTRYSRARAICKQVFDRARKKSWKDYVSGINSYTNINEVWKKVKKLSGKYKIAPAPILKKEDGTMIRDQQEVAEMFAEHIASISDTAAADPVFARYKEAKEQERINFEGEGGAYNDSIQMKELMGALKTCKETSPGHDEVSYIMIKRAHNSLIKLLLKLYNYIYRHRTFPGQWKISVIIPIQKTGKDPQNITNYRPIALTSCLCKLLEKIINVRLSIFLEQRNLISRMQSGFRRCRSTTDNLVELETALRTAIARKQHTVIVFFDLYKAYDTTWKHYIIKKLHHMEVRGHMLYFLHNFMKDRKIFVRLGTTTSTMKNMIEGTPQGSVLSCTLFLLAINDIGQNLAPSVRGSLYVDDFAIYASGSRSQAISRQLQISVRHIEKWANSSGFNFSLDKTVSMHVCRVRNCSKMSPQLRLKEEEVKHVETYKYLGLHIDSSLTFSKHVTMLKDSCTKSINLLKLLSNTAWGADRKLLLKLYMALIKPKLDYGCEAYSSACNTLLASLQPIQNTALRIATGAYRTSPVVSLHAETGVKQLERYRDIKMLSYLLRLKAHNDREFQTHMLDVEEQAFGESRKAKPFPLRAQLLLNKYAFNPSSLAREFVPKASPWNINVNVCQSMSRYKKSEHSQEQLKVMFLNHVEEHCNTEIFYTDGSVSENGVGCAYVRGQECKKWRLNSVATIGTAELQAILKAIEDAVRVGITNVTIVTDSKSSIHSICRYNNMHPLVKEITELICLNNVQMNVCWVPSHVGVTGNERADRAAVEATQMNDLEAEGAVPRQDYRLQLKKLVNRKCEEEWYNVGNNKLRVIKDSVKPMSTAYQKNRDWERKLARLRIGHCALTHKYLLTGENQPYCVDCVVPLTLRHIISECPNYHDDRNNHLHNLNSLSAVLGEGGPVQLNGPLYKYLKEIGIYYQV